MIMSRYEMYYTDEVAPTRFEEAGGQVRFYVTDKPVFPFVVPVEIDKMYGLSKLYPTKDKSTEGLTVQLFTPYVGELGRILRFKPVLEDLL
ncbi:hypothetical protein [Bacillus phage SDFMU_Pbc]|uniref:Uncharacterized protein n=1 Tax=Bacillus phage SDFMU_Pbc TaxID=3076135 RepID=A0AA96QYH0_9CAUD|nr:hypothetical protein [Bacillus phage SDFMU_Pbc]